MKYTSKLILNGQEYQFAEGQPGGGGWQPGADTLAYYSFKGDLENRVDGSLAILGTGSSIGDSYATVSGSEILCPLPTSLNGRGTPYTFSIRAKAYQRPTYNPRIVPDENPCAFGITIGAFSGRYNIITDWTPDEYGAYCGTISLNDWYNIVLTYDGVSAESFVYVNGVKYTYPHAPIANGTGIISSLKLGLNSALDGGYFYLADCILETKVWTAQEVADYFNQTKSLYGIS